MPNGVRDLMLYLGTKSRPVGVQEFSEFWKSCSPEEKQEFQNTPLTPLEKTV